VIDWLAIKILVHPAEARDGTIGRKIRLRRWIF
jgi:hypothetical protein